MSLSRRYPHPPDRTRINLHFSHSAKKSERPNPTPTRSLKPASAIVRVGTGAFDCEPSVSGCRFCLFSNASGPPESLIPPHAKRLITSHQSQITADKHAGLPITRRLTEHQSIRHHHSTGAISERMRRCCLATKHGQIYRFSRSATSLWIQVQRPASPFAAEAFTFASCAGDETSAFVKR